MEFYLEFIFSIFIGKMQFFDKLIINQEYSYILGMYYINVF